MKRDTFDHIVACVMQLKDAEVKTLCEELKDPKLILTLSKYIFRAFEFINDKDASKYFLFFANKIVHINLNNF